MKPSLKSLGKALLAVLAFGCLVALLTLLCIGTLSRLETTHENTKKGLEETFDRFDFDRDGRVSISEASEVFHYLGVSSSITELRGFVSKVEAGSRTEDGTIDKKEFFAFFEQPGTNVTIPPDVVALLFQRFDDNEDKRIVLKEFESSCSKAGLDANPIETFNYFQVLDGNDDGILEWEEFQWIFNDLTSDEDAWMFLRNQTFLGSVLKEEGAQSNGRTYAALATQEDKPEVKHILFIRHGESQANADSNKYGEEVFKWEPHLTEKGEAQCSQAAVNVAQALDAQQLKLELVIVSPLYRTIETASIVFKEQIVHDEVPVKAHPMITELVTGADDLGDVPSNIRFKWASNEVGSRIGWDWFPLEPEVWFWTPNPHAKTVEEARENYLKTRGEIEEPWRNGVKRAEELESWLAARPEKVIAVVSHGDFIETFTGQDLHNAAFYLTEVLPGPGQ